MTVSKLCLLVSAALFAWAGLKVLGVLAGPAVEALALFGFAFWVGSGAVS